jgi:hypothetical protein
LRSSLPQAFASSCHDKQENGGVCDIKKQQSLVNRTLTAAKNTTDSFQRLEGLVANLIKKIPKPGSGKGEAAAALKLLEDSEMRQDKVLSVYNLYNPRKLGKEFLS